MLQWMGGSRRKVASTRKSVQNRQKQYFEQRRLQQQAADGRNFSERKNVYVKNSESNRSLDVLSLQNIPKFAQEHKSTHVLASNEPVHKALNYETIQPLQTFGRFQPREIRSPIPSTIEATSALSSYQLGIANRNMTSVKTPAEDIRGFNSDNDKNQLKLCPEERELCIIDILGDEDPDVCSHKSLEREAHAAFSIEGLGEVEAETPVHTPVHSPEVHRRIFLDGPSPSKIMNPAYSFNHDKKLVELEFELDTMMQKADMTPNRSPLQHSLGSKDRLSLFCEPKQGLFDTDEFSLFNESDNDFNHLLGDGGLFFQGRKRKAVFLPDKILDESTFGLSHNEWMNQMDASTGYVSSMNHRKKEFTFQGSHQPMSRTSMMGSGNFEPTDSPAPYLKHQRPETFHNLIRSDMTGYSPVRSHYDFRDVDQQMQTWHSRSHYDFRDVDQQMQTWDTNEDTRDNVSLRSEESCSSSAVNGVLKKDTLKSKEKQTFESVDVTSSQSFFSEYNMPRWEENCNKWKTAQAVENKTAQGRFTRTSNPLRSKPAHNSNTTSIKMLKADNDRLFETTFDLSKARLGGNSYFHESETTEPPYCNSKLWTDDTFDPSEDPRLYASGSCGEKFSKLSADCSPCCNLKSEIHDFHQPSLENSMFMGSMANLSEDCNVGYRHLHEQSCLAPEQQSTPGDAYEIFDVSTTEHVKCEPEGDPSNSGKSLFSKNGNPRDAANKDKYCCFQEFTDGAAKMEGGKDGNCLEHTEMTSTVTETLDFIDGSRCHVDETSKLDVRTSFSCQTGVEAKLEAERFHPKQRKTEGTGNNGVDPSCQVVMFNSYVLQFLAFRY